MNVKLTLKLKDSTVKAAKRYAYKQNTSLSKLVEQYFQSIQTERDGNILPPVVNELYGAANSTKKSVTKKSYAQYLKEKYQ